MASAALTAPRRVRKAQLARELGVSRQAISNLVKRGVLSEDKDGLVDVELARHAIASRVSPDSKTSQALSVVPAVATAAQPAAAASPQPPSGQPVEEMAITNYHVAKTLNESAMAKMNHLKLREMQGELIRVDAVRTAVASAMSMARESLMQIPTRLAAILAGESDASAIHRMLESEIITALQELGRGLKASALEDGDDDERSE